MDQDPALVLNLHLLIDKTKHFKHRHSSSVLPIPQGTSFTEKCMSLGIRIRIRFRLEMDADLQPCKRPVLRIRIQDP
jgi:hypothetical protein